MWGNIFSGAMSLAQGDSPEEILKKQAMATVMGGTAPVGVESASTVAPHLAQTGAEQAIASGVGGQLGSEMITQNPALTNGLGESSNAFTQFGRDAGGYMGDTFGGVGDTLSEYGTAVNDFTGMEARDWTQLGLSEGLSAMEGTPNQVISHSPVMNTQGIPNALEGQMTGGLLSSHVKPNTPQGFDPNMLRQLKMRGLV
jgi:hypothetical protein